MIGLVRRLVVGGLILGGFCDLAHGEAWQLPTTGSYNDPANWLPASVPNGVGASVEVSVQATATRMINLDTAVTVGSITQTNNTNFTTTLFDGTGGPLTLDAVGDGPVVIQSLGTGAGTDAIGATMIFKDTVVVDVQNALGNASAGAYRLGGPISGPGGLTKNGPGTLTVAFTPSQQGLFKDYAGPTVVNAGRFRVSAGGTPRFTSSVTVNSGGQISMTGSSATFSFGNMLATLPTITLNGNGLAAFPGAIRADQTNSTIPNPIVLASNASISVPTSTTGLTLPGGISGSGALQVGGLPGDPTNQGMLTLSVPSTHTGGTTVTQGTLFVQSGSSLGTGNVYVDGISSSGISRAAGKLTIDSPDSIADNAILTITGDETVSPDGAVGGFVNMGFGTSETVGALILGGVVKTVAGTYGSTASAATFQDDRYFTGIGEINLVPTVIPGDYNGNGSVDAADYVAWKSGGPLLNDPTPGVQADDYTFWGSRFGVNSPTGGSGLSTAPNVPEASTATLACVLLVTLAGYAKRGGVLRESR